MFEINELEKDDLLEYIKTLYDVMDKKDKYIDALEEKIYMEKQLNILDDQIEDAQKSLRAALIKMDMFGSIYNNYKKPIFIDLNEDEETDKVKEPKIRIGDFVTCSFLLGEYIVYDRDGSIYRIRNIENNNEYIALEDALTKVSKEETKCQKDLGE